MVFIMPSGRTFRMWCDEVEVTSNHRPDPSWRYIDAAGHVHGWYMVGPNGELTLASSYDQQARYDLPSVRLVVEIESDDYHPAVSHHECLQCGEHVAIGYTADTYRVFVPGLKHYTIDGAHVSEEEFKREVDIDRSKLA